MNGYGGIIIVNLFAWRARNPGELPRVPAPVGAENDEHIRWACQTRLSTVVAGWGSDPFAFARGSQVRALIASYHPKPLQCFGRTHGGHPRHPLYLRYAAAMVNA